MFFRLLSISFAAGLFLLLAVNTWNIRMTTGKPRIILLTVESLRSDQITEENCPNLLLAGQEAVRLENFKAVSGWTAANIVSLLSGYSPFTHGVHTRGQSIDPALQLPLEQLAEAGYIVAGLQPFMAMDLYSNLGLSLSDAHGDPKLWLATRQQQQVPFMLWYHYLHTHLPYATTPTTQNEKQNTTDPTQRQRLELVRTQASIHHNETHFQPEDVAFITRMQQENIREFDHWFGNFWTFLQKGGFLRNTIIIVTADHGDEHGERGQVGHASTNLAGHLHREIVDIPCFIWLPPGDAAKPQINPAILASHIDIMPTLLGLIGISPDKGVEGKNLFAESAANKNSWFAMTSSGGFAEPDPEKIRYFEYAHLENAWKSILRIYRQGRSFLRLYNIADDPAELHDVAGKYPDIAKQHRLKLESRIARSTHHHVKTRSTPASGNELALAPEWTRPTSSTTISYDMIGDTFTLSWRGTPNATYLIEYHAGQGTKSISGTLEVKGTSKDFGHIEKQYWQKWIVPLSPYRLRVRSLAGGAWSKWLVLDAVP